MLKKKLKQLADNKLVKQGVDMGIDTVKDGIGSIVNTILIKIVITFTAITVITIGGCATYNSLTEPSEPSGTLSEVQQIK